MAKKKKVKKKAAPKKKATSKKKGAAKETTTKKTAPSKAKKPTEKKIVSLNPHIASLDNEVVTEPDPMKVRDLELERAQDLLAQKKRAREVLSRYEDALMKWKGVSGVDVGLWSYHGEVRVPLQYVIQVFVSLKRPMDDKELRSPLPAFLEEIPVNVVECEFRTADADTFEPVIKGGIAIGRGEAPRTSGTLGLVVYKTSLGNLPMYLTNKHVVGELNAEVIQPPSGNVPPGTTLRIGSVFDSEINDTVDCAIVLPELVGRPHSEGIKVEPPEQPPPPLISQGDLDGIYVDGSVADLGGISPLVFKVGAATGSNPIEIGIVESASRRAFVINSNGDINEFFQQIVVKPSRIGQQLILKGDSGAVLILQKTINGVLLNKVVGLVHGMSLDGTRIIACPFLAVQDELGISVEND